MPVTADVRLAFCFPGQGSQAVGMGRAFHDASPAARAVFEEASDTLGFDVAKLCFEGPESELQLTANTQPTVLTVSVAGARLLAERGLAPAVVGGHSLGEYSALVAAGALAFADAVRVVRLRGEFMQEAVPVGTGAMAAILGAELPVVEAICREAADGEVLDVANINSPGQIVVAGHRSAVERAVAVAPAHGIKRTVVLPVSAPFHCRLMAPAAERLTAVLSEIRAADPRTQRGRGAHHARGRRAALPGAPGHGAGPVDRLRRAHGA
jgi:[acyl-carrier-protein] S-malonyltransferase